MDEITDKEAMYGNRQSGKYCATILGAILFIYLTDLLIQGYHFLFLSNKEPKVLQDLIINDNFIPENYSTDDVVFDEFLITSWDINSRTPRFFSKWAKQNIVDDEGKQDYDMTLDQMTMASAAIPLYFYPYEVGGNYYTSGDNIASSPAMFAYMHAVDRLGHNAEDIRLVNVGALVEMPLTISTKASVLDWLQRLPALYTPSKMHTMKYQSSMLMHLNNREFYDF